MLRSQRKKMHFERVDPIFILEFLKEFCNACDTISIHEKAAIWLISYFMKNRALSSLKARLSSKKIHATGLEDEWLLSCVKNVNYLVTTYANDDIIAHAVKESEFYMKAPRVVAAFYAKRLYTEAVCSEIVYEVVRV